MVVIGEVIMASSHLSRVDVLVSRVPLRLKITLHTTLEQPLFASAKRLACSFPPFPNRVPTTSAKRAGVPFLRRFEYASGTSAENPNINTPNYFTWAEKHTRSKADKL